MRDLFNYTEKNVEEKLKAAKRRLEEDVREWEEMRKKEEEVFKGRKRKLEEVEGGV